MFGFAFQEDPSTCSVEMGERGQSGSRESREEAAAVLGAHGDGSWGQGVVGGAENQMDWRPILENRQVLCMDGAGAGA